MGISKGRVKRGRKMNEGRMTWESEEERNMTRDE